jgi:hypothetical protein
MRTRRSSHVQAAAAAAAALLLAAFPASAQSPRFAEPGQLPRIGERAQAAVLESVTTAIDTLYVIEDTAGRIIARLKERFAEGAYRELKDPAEFALQLDRDARAVYDDHHFAIRALLPADPEAGDESRDPVAIERFQRSLREANYGFAKAEILAGNVGYLRLTRFADTKDGGETAVAAMNFLANANALIVDVRGNPGGSASMIKLVSSYLFDENRHLISWYERDTGEDVQSWSFDYVPGKRMPDIPLYVLADGATGSAAEEFTFDMKHLGRGTVVGDTTSGGGHTVTQAVFHFDGFRIGMRIPYGRAYDPKTGLGWEGTGVIPDIAVPGEQALDVAHREALGKLMAAAEGAERKAPLEWAMAGLDGRLNPVTLTVDEKGAYVGRYGPRTIFMEGEGLFYQREGRPPMAVEPMAKDLFRVGSLEFFRLRFERDASGRVTRLVGLYDDGRTDANDRSQ